MAGQVKSGLSFSSEERVLIRGAQMPGVRGRRDAFLEGGEIKQLAAALQVPSGAKVLDADGLWLLPGWIDVQLNDMEWLAQGLKEPTEHTGRVREVLRYQAERGVTGLVLATLAAPLDQVLAYLKGMNVVLSSPSSPLDTVFLGGLVEGTFLNPEYHGAHNPDWVLPPDKGVLDQLLETGAVRLLNVAPEVSPKATELIAHATKQGVIVGVGHARPHAELLRKAIEAGLRYVIHLGNGPTGSDLKAFHDGGLLEEALRNDALIVTLILDGYHVHLELVRDWMRRKEISRCIGVSDAGFAMGPPRGDFEVFGIRGRTSSDGRYLKVVRSDSDTAAQPLSSGKTVLFGSAAGMREVFENALNLLTRDMEGVYYRSHPALGVEEAIEAACAITSGNPASLLGLEDRGELAVGRRADVLLVEIGGKAGEYSVTVRHTWVGGVPH